MTGYSPMGFVERYLSLWIAISIVVGLGLGIAVPAIFQTIATLEYANVNFVVALFIWLMIYPMMVNIDFASIRRVGCNPKGLSVTLVVNWLIKPFSMAALAVLFFDYLFVGLVLPPAGKEYIAGMILLGVAPCTAMVFVWSQLVDGDANYTLVQVALNDIIMIFAFAPLAALLLGVSDIVVPWSTLIIAVLLYVVIPLLAGYISNRLLTSNGCERQISRFSARLKPFALIGLLATVILLFALQAPTIVAKPLVIALIALPLISQSYLIFLLAYGWAYLWRLPFTIAAPAALISTSNFFELAVAVAISLFGLDSGAALATVVGVLVEVPVMLSLVAIAKRSRHRFISAGG